MSNSCCDSGSLSSAERSGRTDQPTDRRWPKGGGVRQLPTTAHRTGDVGGASGKVVYRSVKQTTQVGSRPCSSSQVKTPRWDVPPPPSGRSLMGPSAGDHSSTSVTSV